VITGPAELVRHRFDGYYTVALGLLPLIEAFDPGIVSDGDVGCFDRGLSRGLRVKSGVDEFLKTSMIKNRSPSGRGLA
jgi:hypothetical protein